MTTLYQLPRKLGCAIKPSVLRRKKYAKKADVIPIGCNLAAAYALYQQASKLDETDPSAAIAVYRRALQLNPDLAVAHTNLGNCYYWTGAPAAAKECYQRAFSIDPDQPEAAYNLGYMLIMHDRRPAEAVGLFKRALANDPMFADAWYNLGLALKDTGMAHNALPVQNAFRKYLALSNDSTYVETAKQHLTNQ